MFFRKSCTISGAIFMLGLLFVQSSFAQLKHPSLSTQPSIQPPPERPVLSKKEYINSRKQFENLLTNELRELDRLIQKVQQGRLSQEEALPQYEFRRAWAEANFLSLIDLYAQSPFVFRSTVTAEETYKFGARQLYLLFPVLSLPFIVSQMMELIPQHYKSVVAFILAGYMARLGFEYVSEKNLALFEELKHLPASKDLSTFIKKLKAENLDLFKLLFPQENDFKRFLEKAAEKQTLTRSFGLQALKYCEARLIKNQVPAE